MSNKNLQLHAFENKYNQSLDLFSYNDNQFFRVKVIDYGRTVVDEKFVDYDLAVKFFNENKIKYEKIFNGL